MIKQRKFWIPIIVLICLGIFACSGKQDNDESSDSTSTAVDKPTLPKAIAKAVIQSASESTLTGEAVFEETSDGVTLTLTVTGATPGTHAVHLHINGDCSAADAASAGGHWNPHEVDHGHRGHGSFHSGDIDNLEVGEDGTGSLSMTATDWSIGGDSMTNVVGRAVIIHASADDFVSQPAGNAGPRVGCGVVEIVP